MRIRLTAKITVLIILVLIIGFGVSTILTIKRESELLVEQNKMAARQLIGTLVSSIETAMLSERPDITRGIIDDLRNSKVVQGLVVYRRNGVEAFTDLATLREVSKEAELPKGVMASIEKMRREPGRTMAGPLFTRALDTLETQEALESREVYVRIGSENDLPALRSMSLVAANYGLPQRNLGTVSVIGPTRMDYFEVIGTVRAAAGQLSRFVEDVYER